LVGPSLSASVRHGAHLPPQLRPVAADSDEAEAVKVVVSQPSMDACAPGSAQNWSSQLQAHCRRTPKRSVERRIGGAGCTTIPVSAYASAVVSSCFLARSIGSTSKGREIIMAHPRHMAWPGR
jgi:hypothetical protein